MSIKDYRDQIDREIERAKAEPTSAGPERARELLVRSAAEAADLATEEVGAAAPEDLPTHEIAARRLEDPNAPPDVRRIALQVLKQEAISSPSFDTWRPRYLEALRSAAKTADAETRRAALEALAQHKDPYVQQMLLDGLRDPDRAAVPVEDALSLLTYDVHAEVHDVAAAIADAPPSDRARREALRILASNPESADRFAELFADPEEDSKVRRLAATALSSLDPARFRSVARDLVGSETDLEAEAADLAATAPEAPEDPDVVRHTRKLLELVE